MEGSVSDGTEPGGPGHTLRINSRVAVLGVIGESNMAIRTRPCPLLTTPSSSVAPHDLPQPHHLTRGSS